MNKINKFRSRNPKIYLRNGIFILALLAGILGISLPASQPVSAQSVSPYDLIAAVNALRTANGLPAYEVDSYLMSFAQTHSEYMASIQSITHTRSDGSSPRDYGIVENIAGGTNLSLDYVIYTMWSDADHWHTMVGIPSGYIGAGIAEGDGWTYFTIDVRRTSGGYTYTQPAGGTPAATVPPMYPVLTVTAMPDGSIIHEVLPGQSLWAIAIGYGLKIADLLLLNQLPTNAVIYEGQKLVIQPSFTPTLTPTITETPPPATRTPTASPTPRTPTPTRTAAPTLTPTPKPFLGIDIQEGQSRKMIAIGLIAICGLGLLVVLLGGIRRK